VSRVVIWTICALLCAPETAAPAQTLGPEIIVERFVRAWNAHDIDAFRALFTEDTDWVTASATTLKGRTAIVSWLQKEHVGWARATVMTVKNTSARDLGHDAAIVLLAWELTGLTDSDGKPAAPAPGVTVFVVTRNPIGWHVVAGQVTSGRPG
jgi:uncharacterized protein (TIGR02246 family)